MTQERLATASIDARYGCITVEEFLGSSSYGWKFLRHADLVPMNPSTWTLLRTGKDTQGRVLLAMSRHGISLPDQQSRDQVSTIKGQPHNGGVCRV